MKYFAFLTVLFSAQALASGFVVGETYSAGQLDAYVENIEVCRMDGGPIARAPGSPVLMSSLKCSTKQAINAGLTATAITVEIVGACTAVAVVSTPVTLSLMGAGAILHVVSFAVDQLPCEDDKQKQEMCKLLIANGYKCDPNKL